MAKINKTVAQIEDGLRPYKVYIATFINSGNGSEFTVNELENTMGVDITWSFYDGGRYFISTSESTFTSNKTIIIPSYSTFYTGSALQYITIKRLNDSSISFTVGNNDADLLPNPLPVEIRVYD